MLHGIVMEPWRSLEARPEIAYGHVSPHLHHIPDIYELLEGVDVARGTTGHQATAV